MTRSRFRSFLCSAAIAAPLVGLLAAREVPQGRVSTPGEVLACGRAALGAARTLAALKAVSVVLDTIPDPRNERNQPSTSEVLLGFPDTFTQTDTLRLSGTELVRQWGFVKGRPVASARSNNQETRADGPSAAILTRARGTFARLALILLLRETPVVPLTWKPGVQSDGPRVKIAASGPDGFNITLVLNADTCQVEAAEWERPANAGDGVAGRTTPNGRHVDRYQLLDHTEFEGVRLPRRIVISIDGVPQFEQKITRVRVNPLPVP